MRPDNNKAIEEMVGGGIPAEDEIPDAHEPLTDEEREWLQTQVRRSQTATERLHSDWRDNWKYYQGEGQEDIFDFSDDEMREWATDEIRIANFTKATVQNMLPNLRSGVPQWHVVAPDGSPQDGMTDYLQAWRDQTNFRKTLKSPFRDAIIFGTGFMKLTYDSSMTAKGEVTAEWQDPFCVFPDLYANSLKECYFVGILNQYGEKQAEEIFDGEGVYEKIDIEEAERTSLDDTTHSPLADEKPSSEAERDDDLVNVWEVYYDFGRSKIIYTGDQVLYDGPNPLGDYPLYVFFGEANDFTFWGNSIMEDWKPLQDTINVTRIRVMISARIHSSPQKVVVNAPNVEINNKPNAVYNLPQADSDVRNIEAPELPGYVWELYGITRQEWDYITGVQDASRGKRPGGVRTGVAIQALQQAAMKRPSELARDWGDVIQKIGDDTFMLMQLNYTTSRRLPYHQSGEISQAEMPIEDISTTKDPESGNVSAIRFPKRDFRVVTAPAHDRPLTRTERGQEAMQLFQAGAIDQQALLDELNFPSRRQIVRRMQKQQEEQARMQMLAQAAGQGDQQAMAELVRGEEKSPEKVAKELGKMLPEEDLFFLKELRDMILAEEPVPPVAEARLDEIMDSADTAEMVEIFLTAPPQEEMAQQPSGQAKETASIPRQPS